MVELKLIKAIGEKSKKGELKNAGFMLLYLCDKEVGLKHEPKYYYEVLHYSKETVLNGIKEIEDIRNGKK